MYTYAKIYSDSDESFVSMGEDKIFQDLQPVAVGLDDGDGPPVHASKSAPSLGDDLITFADEVHSDQHTSSRSPCGPATAIGDPFDLLVNERYSQAVTSPSDRSPNGQPTPDSTLTTSSSCPNQLPPQHDKEGISTEGQEVEHHAGEARELHIWAMPLYAGRGAQATESGSATRFGSATTSAPPSGQEAVDCLVFLPVTGWTEEPEQQQTGWQGQIQSRFQKIKQAASETWDSMGEKDPGTLQHNVHSAGRRMVENQTAEERLTHSIPKNVSKVIIHHPSIIGPDLIMAKLQSISSKHGTMSTIKTAAAALVLPLAFGIDTVVIPGPAIMTYFTSYQLWKSATAAVGSRRLTRYIAQSGSAKDVRVNYCGDHKLDTFYEAAQTSADGVLGEAELEALVAAVHQRELLQPLIELRARHLRQTTVTTAEGYALLPNAAP